MSVTFGEERGCPNAYTLKRPFIISAMSFGALGEQAVGPSLGEPRKLVFS